MSPDGVRLVGFFKSLVLRCDKRGDTWNQDALGTLLVSTTACRTHCKCEETLFFCRKTGHTRKYVDRDDVSIPRPASFTFS